MSGDSHSGAAPQPTAIPTSLAEMIYVQLSSRAFTAEGGKPKMGLDPAAIAKMSLELAGVFMKADHEAEVDLLPKNQGYDVKQLDLGSLGI